MKNKMNFVRVAALCAVSAAMGCFLSSCYKGESSTESQTSAETMAREQFVSIAERARIAREERKAKLEAKRSELSEYYTQREEGNYKSKVFFADEFVGSDDLRLQVPSNYLGVLSIPKDVENSTHKITLINDDEKIAVSVISSPVFEDVNLKDSSFCRNIQSKLTAYSNYKVIKTPQLYIGQNASVCRLYLQDVTTNRSITQIIETYADGSAVQVNTYSSNDSFAPDIIIRQGLRGAFSPLVKNAARLAVLDFYDTENFEEEKL